MAEKHTITIPLTGREKAENKAVDAANEARIIRLQAMLKEEKWSWGHVEAGQRPKRESQRALLNLLWWLWGLKANEGAEIAWEASRAWYGEQIDMSVTTIGLCYQALGEAGWLYKEYRHRKPCILRPTWKSLPLVRLMAEKQQKDRKPRHKTVQVQKRLLQPSDRKENSEGGSNLEDKGPSGGLFTGRAKDAFSAMNQIPLRAPPAESPA